MKKTLLLVLLFNTGIAFASNAQPSANDINQVYSIREFQKLKYGNNLIPVGNINTSITETIKLKPDMAEFSITYITDGKTPNDASNRNQNNMKAFKTYLSSLEITDENLTTIDYQNYEQEVQTTLLNENKKYQSSLKISLKINVKEQFPTVFKILDENQINNIKYDDYKNYYIVNVIETGSTLEEAKEKANSKYLSLSKNFNVLNINNISILEYDSQEMPQESTNEKRYYVRNTVKINIVNLDNIGKIIAKAQELKMIVNNDINYQVSDLATQQAIDKYEATLLNKLNKKVERLLAEQYLIGMPTQLTSSGSQDRQDVMQRNYSYRPAVINSIASKSQQYQSNTIDIQPPSEFKITLTLSGSFEILKKVVEQ